MISVNNSKGLKKLSIIGNGDAFGSGGRYHTCFYLESSETKFLVDLGATAIHKLQSSVDINELNIIIISHLHGDHFGGIPFFLLNSSFQTNRESPLTIIGPKGTQNRIETLTDNLYKGILGKIAQKFDLEFIEYQAKVPVRFGDLEITAFTAIHSVQAESHSIQVKCGNSKFAYSGDTEWTDNLYKISEDADYFLCECTYYSTKREGHLNYIELAKKIPDISAKNILLTHLSQEMLDNTIETKVDLVYAEEDKLYKF